MKKLFYALMCALMVIALPSCKFDNDKDFVPAEELLVGTWKLQSYKYTEKENGQVIGSGTAKATNDDYTMLSLRADGTFTFLDIESNYSYESNGTWMSSSSTLILKYQDSDTETYTILSISKTKAVLREVDTYEYDGIKCEDTYDLTFTKK